MIKRNSTDETCVKDLEQLKSYLSKSEHCPDELEELEPKAVERPLIFMNEAYIKPTRSDKPASSLVFSTKYFKEVRSLKKLVHDMKGDISSKIHE